MSKCEAFLNTDLKILINVLKIEYEFGYYYDDDFAQYGPSSFMLHEH